MVRKASPLKFLGIRVDRYRVNDTYFGEYSHLVCLVIRKTVLQTGRFFIVTDDDLHCRKQLSSLGVRFSTGFVGFGILMC